MTIRAKEIGLTNSHFKNSTGWPDPEHKMSSKDLVTLATKIREEYPSYYKIFDDLEFTWDKISQKNRNPLLSMNVGADGLKTGYTEEAGYGLIASAKQNKRRITFVITGLNSVGQRAREAKGITTWAFKKFKLKTFWKKTNATFKWKLQVYNAVIIAQLIYGLDTMHLTDGQLAKIDAFQAKT